LDDKYKISPFSCDGCDFCRRVCPSNAISLTQSDDSKWFIANTRFGPFIHAKLGIGEDNSGKLVAKVKNEAKEIAEDEFKDYVIVDGSPGVGCPVVSSLSGAKYVVIVTEPSVSGLHDLKRVVQLADTRIGMIHGWGAPNGIEKRVLDGFSAENIDVLVFGHSHRPVCRRAGSVLLLNPGSPTDRRSAPHHTVGLLHIGQGVEGEIIRID
jgi:ferredoxin